MTQTQPKECVFVPESNFDARFEVYRFELGTEPSGRNSYIKHDDGGWCITTPDGNTTVVPITATSCGYRCIRVDAAKGWLVALADRRYVVCESVPSGLPCALYGGADLAARTAVRLNQGVIPKGYLTWGRGYDDTAIGIIDLDDYADGSVHGVPSSPRGCAKLAHCPALILDERDLKLATAFGEWQRGADSFIGPWPCCGAPRTSKHCADCGQHRPVRPPIKVGEASFSLDEARAAWSRVLAAKPATPPPRLACEGTHPFDLLGHDVTKSIR